MAYTLNHTNSNLTPIVVPDGQIDTSTSLKFVGKTVQNYGGIIDQNFLNLMENFASYTEPAKPVTGQIWYDLADKNLKYYSTNSIFKKIGGSYTGANAPPGYPDDGDLWLDISSPSAPLLKVWATNTWITVGPAGAQATVTGELLLDTDLNTHTAITFNIDGLRYAILSNDETVYRTRQSSTDGSPIPGFYTVGPGLNIADTGQVLGNRFWGTATGAEKLLLPQAPGLGDVYLTAHDFIRANTAGFTTGSLTVKNNTGLTLGASNQLTMNFNNLDFNINSLANNGNTRFNTKDSGGTAHNVLNLFGNGNATFGQDLFIGGTLHTYNLATGTLNLTANAISTNVSSGTLIMTGGMGLTGNINAGGNTHTLGGSLALGTSVTDFTSGRTNFTVNGTTDSVIYLQKSGANKLIISATDSAAGITSQGVPLTVKATGSNYIDFWTNSLQRLFIAQNGMVGIGLNSPAYTLDVLGTINAFGNITEKGNATLNSANYNNYVPALDGTGAHGTWNISISGGVSGTADHSAESYSVNLNNEGTKKIVYNAWAGGSGYPGYVYTGPSNGRFGFSASNGFVDVYTDGHFYSNEGASLVLDAANFNNYAPTLTGTGASGTWNINISGTAATATTAASLVSTNNYSVQDLAASRNIAASASIAASLDVTAGRNIGAGGYITAAGDIYAFNTSDRNLKTKIKPIKNALDKLCQLSGNTFEWSAEHLATKPEQYRQAADVGVIAQEVKSVLPEAVMTRPDGTLAVDYNKIVPLLVEAIKELREELTNIKKPSLLSKLTGKK